MYNGPGLYPGMGPAPQGAYFIYTSDATVFEGRSSRYACAVLRMYGLRLCMYMIDSMSAVEDCGEEAGVVGGS